MLIKSAEELIKKVDRKQTLELMAEQAVGFNTRESEFAALVQSMHLAVLSLRIFKKSGFLIAPFDEEVDSLLRKIQETQSHLGLNPQWICSSEFTALKFKECVSATVTSIENVLRVLWRQFVEQHCPQISADVLDVLEGVRDFNGPVRHIRTRLRRIETLKAELPKHADEFAALKAITVEIEDAWKALGSSSVPHEVLEFLKASTGDTGAPLLLYNGEVQRWLEQHRIERSFTIKAVA